ncbi:MAG: ABC transporter permease [Bacteroidia bacterium]
MNLSFYLAGKLTSDSGHSFTGRIIKIASVSVAISMAVMLLAIGIVKGFQKEIKQKVSGFSGHIIIKNLDLNQSGELVLFPQNQPFLKKVNKLPYVDAIVPFCQKPGILRTATDAEGIQCKGVGPGYGTIFIDKLIIRGRGLGIRGSEDLNEILISETTANRLKLDTGQRVELYFIHENQVRRRKPLICGIFNTGVSDIDKNWVLTDIRMIQRIYTHGYDSINGYEVYLSSLFDLDKRTKLIDEELGTTLVAQSVNETHFQIFQWLSLLDMNVLVIIFLMVIVAVVNMMTALLVLIIDRTPMIGIFKALGSRNKLIRQMFLYNGARYILKGLLAGNFVGLGIGFIQQHWGIIKLNEETYYLSKVPFSISLTDVLLVNGLTFIVCFVLLTIPAMYVARIQPVKAIRFN